MITHRTPAQIPEMDAIRRCDTLRELPPAKDDLTPGGFFIMLGVAALAGIVIWALLVLLFSVVTP